MRSSSYIEKWINSTEKERWHRKLKINENHTPTESVLAFKNKKLHKL
jgi:hypothetical protein